MNVGCKSDATKMQLRCSIDATKMQVRAQMQLRWSLDEAVHVKGNLDRFRYSLNSVEILFYIISKLLLNIFRFTVYKK